MEPLAPRHICNKKRIMVNACKSEACGIEPSYRVLSHDLVTYKMQLRLFASRLGLKYQKNMASSCIRLIWDMYHAKYS